jgi:hypothetical protein
MVLVDAISSPIPILHTSKTLLQSAGADVLVEGEGERATQRVGIEDWRIGELVIVNLADL